MKHTLMKLMKHPLKFAGIALLGLAASGVAVAGEKTERWECQPGTTIDLLPGVSTGRHATVSNEAQAGPERERLMQEFAIRCDRCTITLDEDGTVYVSGESPLQTSIEDEGQVRTWHWLFSSVFYEPAISVGSTMVDASSIFGNIQVDRSSGQGRYYVTTGFVGLHDVHPSVLYQQSLACKKAGAEQKEEKVASQDEEALALDRSQRREIQSCLAWLNFDPGPADGLFGPRSRSAIRAWQEERNTEATGFLSADEVQALLASCSEMESWEAEVRELIETLIGEGIIEEIRQEIKSSEWNLVEWRDDEWSLIEEALREEAVFDAIFDAITREITQDEAPDFFSAVTQELVKQIILSTVLPVVFDVIDRLRMESEEGENTESPTVERPVGEVWQCQIEPNSFEFIRKRISYGDKVPRELINNNVVTLTAESGVLEEDMEAPTESLEYTKLDYTKIVEDGGFLENYRMAVHAYNFGTGESELPAELAKFFEGGTIQFEGFPAIKALYYNTSRGYNKQNVLFIRKWRAIGGGDVDMPSYDYFFIIVANESGSYIVKALLRYKRDVEYQRDPDFNLYNDVYYDCKKIR